MELEDLKQRWKNADQQYKIADYDLNAILAKKVNSPLNSLRKKYKLQLITLPIAFVVLVIMNFVEPALRYNAMIWIAIPLLPVQVFRYYLNYKVVLRMLNPEDNGVKQRLEENLRILRKDAKLDLQVLRLILVLLIAAVEITVYYNLVPAYAIWGNVSLALRTGVYAVLFVVQPYISMYFFNHHFGQYINQLQELSDQAAEA